LDLLLKAKKGLAWTVIVNGHYAHSLRPFVYYVKLGPCPWTLKESAPAYWGLGVKGAFGTNWSLGLLRL